VFVNVVGGMRLDEPAVDLGLALAVASSQREVPVDPATLVLGEVGLAGEVRAVQQVEPRVAEAAKMGFKRFLLPAANAKKLKRPGVVAVRTLREAIDLALA
jgi:DNA repair protein RadA/Sms